MREITFKQYVKKRGFFRIDSSKYQSDKYYIFSGCNRWWYLYARSDKTIPQYDIYCGMFKTCKKAIDASVELDRLDKKAKIKNAWIGTLAGNNCILQDALGVSPKMKIGDKIKVRLPNDWMTK